MANRTLPKSAEDFIFVKNNSNISKISISKFLWSLMTNFISDLGESIWRTRTKPKSAEDYIFAKISSNILIIGIGWFSELLIPNFTLDFGN